MAVKIISGGGDVIFDYVHGVEFDNNSAVIAKIAKQKELNEENKTQTNTQTNTQTKQTTSEVKVSKSNLIKK